MAKKQKPNGYWNNKERCAESASKYSTRKEWQNADGSAYRAARKNGWLDECCAHMERIKKPNGYWNKERCAESASHCSTRGEWEMAAGSAYYAARKNGWLDECCAQMSRVKQPNGYWTKERCAESAKLYATRAEWCRAERSAYNSALNNGWLDECCAHMGLPVSAAFSHKEYVAQLADIRPDYKVIGEYVDAKTKIAHQCSKGHQWEASPSNIKRGRGCPQCMDMQRDENVVYCWKVIDGPDDLPQALDGYHLVKFGITSQDCSQDRIKVAATKNRMQHEVLVYQHTNMMEAGKYEKWLHDLGQYVAMPDRIDGRTEFRLVSDSELRFIKDMLPGSEVLMPKREPGSPLSVRMTAEEVRQGCAA